MKFFTPIDDFTHYGSFYGIPCYFGNLDKEAPLVAGTNIIYTSFLYWWPQTIMRISNTLINILESLDLIEYQEPMWFFYIKGEIK